jgi:hypothetical protein
MINAINELPAMLEKSETRLLASINELKANGRFVEKLAACAMEEEYWCMAALNS